MLLKQFVFECFLVWQCHNFSISIISLTSWIYTYAVLSRFSAHAPISEHAPVLKYRCTRVNGNKYNIGASEIFKKVSKHGFSALGACAKKVLLYSTIYILVDIHEKIMVGI